MGFREIWKFKVEGDNCNIEMPVNAEILSVAEQNGHMFIWAFVDKDAKRETRRFNVFGTGRTIKISPSLYFLGTVFMKNGHVFHVFEVISDEQRIVSVAS